MSPKDCAYIVERLAIRFMALVTDHERQLTEHRAAFVARTEADAKIIAGLRAEIIRVNEAHGRTKVENDGLRDELAAQRDAFTAEVAALKSQTPKQHPVKVGEWVVRTAAGAQLAPIGTVAQVVSVADGLPDGYEYVIAGGRWHSDYCEPCDPPATHDTDAGKVSAEAALKTEPVAEEIKVGDVVEVVSHTGRNTWLADVGSVGTVVTVEEINDSISVHLEHVPGKKNALAGYVSFCDVRKVTA